MVHVTLVFFHQKTNVKWRHFNSTQREHRPTFSCWIPFVFILPYNSNGPIEQTYWRPSFYNEHIDWGNSDSKWMKVSWINSNVTNISQLLNFWLTFSEGFKLIENCFNRPHVNPFNDTFATTNSFQQQFLTGNQSALRERKERIKKLLK